MPVTIDFSTKVVLLSDKNKTILAAYQAALNEEFKKEVTSADEITLVGLKAQSREEWWVPLVSTIHRVTGIKLATTDQRTLLPFSIKLDLPAAELYRIYREYLNEITAQQAQIGVLAAILPNSSKQARSGFVAAISPTSVFDLAEQEKIGKDYSYILLREILLRLAAVALSEEMDGCRNGTVLVEVARKFTQAVIRSRVLGSAEQAYTPLESALVTTHLSQLEVILSTVEILKNLHSNRQHITAALNFLNKIEYRLQAHIVLMLNPNKPEKSVSENWIDTTLSEIETEMQQKKPVPENSSALVPHTHSTDLTKVQREVIQRYKPDDRLKHDTVEYLIKRYQLLNRARSVKQLLGYIDMLRVVAGWLPILCGGLNMDNVGRAITDLTQECDRYTRFTDALDPRIKTPVGRAVAALQIQNVSLSWAAIGICESLSSLTQPERLRLIQEVGKQTILGLMEVQEKLNISILDTDKIQAAFPGYLSPAAPQVSSVRPALVEPSSLPVVESGSSAKSAPQKVLTTAFLSQHTSQVESQEPQKKVVVQKFSALQADPEERITTAIGYLKQGDFEAGVSILQEQAVSLATTDEQKAICYRNLAELASTQEYPALTLQQGYEYAEHAAKLNDMSGAYLFAKATEQGWNGQSGNPGQAFMIYKGLNDVGYQPATPEYLRLLSTFDA